MKERGLFLLISLSACLFSVSCKTTVYLTNRYDPEIIPEKKPATVLFINNFDYTKPDISIQRFQRSYHETIDAFARGLLKGFENRDSLTLVIADTLYHGTPAGMLTTLLPVETIDSLCRIWDASIVVSLDSIFFRFSFNEDYITSIEWVNFYSRNFYLFTEVFLSAYDSRGDLINRSSIDRTVYYAWRMSLLSGLAINPSVSGIHRKVENVSFPMGQEYASKFFPLEESYEKKLYSGEVFGESNRLMREGRWDAAVEILNGLAGSANATTAKRAAYNLEVAKEGAENQKRGSR